MACKVAMAQGQVAGPLGDLPLAQPRPVLPLSVLRLLHQLLRLCGRGKQGVRFLLRFRAKAVG